MANPTSTADPQLFKKFLDKFCRELEPPSFDEDDRPLKLYSPCILPSEVEGECLSWVLQYLSIHNCPQLLASHIARSVYVHVSKQDLSSFSLPEHENDDDDDDDNSTDHDNKESISEPHIPQIDANRLLKEVLTAVHDICKQWQQTLPILHISQRVFETSTHAIKNTRRKMEDVHIVIPDLNSLYNLKEEPTQSFYAVFDGHGGVNAAVYCSCHLHTNMIRDPHFNDDTATATKRAYALTDQRFTDRAKKGNLRSGTTCVTALIRGSTLHVSWLGDSQAILVKNGGVVNIMEPHKPEREDERSRIEALGGYVIFFGAWRVNGNIAVSRAIGDVTQKPFVCSDADVASFELDGQEDYVVLACDGVWDVLEPSDIPDIVYTHVKTHGSKSEVAKAIVDQSRDRGSSDNISVVVVFFRDDIAAPQGTPLAKPLSENGMNNFRMFGFGDSDRKNTDSGNTDNSGLNNGTGSGKLSSLGKSSSEGPKDQEESDGDKLSSHGKSNRNGSKDQEETERTSYEECSEHDGKRTILNKAAAQKSFNLSSQVWGSLASSFTHKDSGFVGHKKWTTSRCRKNKSGRRRNAKVPKMRRVYLSKDWDGREIFSHSSHYVSNHRLNLAAKNNQMLALFQQLCIPSENKAAALKNVLNEKNEET